MTEEPCEGCVVLHCYVKIDNETLSNEALWNFDLAYWTCLTLTVVIGFPINIGIGETHPFND